MAIARDWLRTLYQASYKGVPFFVEHDQEPGSRRIVEHEFPMRDDPFLEDLGEGVRRYRVTAYLASDSADSDAATLMATCAQRGPGVLVLPTHGPLTVRCKEFARSRSKDRSGYIAFDLHFLREGAPFALVTVASLANQVFLAADGLAAAAIEAFQLAAQTPARFHLTAQVLGQANYVAEALIEGVQNSAAVLDAIRISSPVDPEVSGEQRDAIQLIHDEAPKLAILPLPGEVDPVADLPARLFAATRALGDAMPASAAIAAFEPVFTETPTAAPVVAIATPSNLAEAANQDLANANLRLLALTAYAEAIARAELPDRPAALTLRADVAEYFEAELMATSAADVDLAHAIAALRDAAIDYLSRAILDLAPVITVDVNAVLPSLFLAHRLYQDPTRSDELVARNKLAHPSFFPLEFEAVAR